MRHRLFLFAALSLALVGWDCAPVTPEQDPLLATSPDAVARLRAEHGPVIDVVERMGNGAQFVPVPADSPYLPLLAQGVRGIRHARGVNRAAWLVPGRPLTACPDDQECTSFALELDHKRPFRAAAPLELSFDFVVTEAQDDEHPPVLQPATSPQASLVRFDPAVVTAGAQAYLDRVFADLAAYEADFDAERMAILADLLGCPDDTIPAYDDTACWCEDPEGERHGAYVQGDRSMPVLQGPRLMEGAYVHGRQHGTWIYRDAQGAELRRELWKNGSQVDARAPDDPDPHPMSKPPPDEGP